MSAHLFRISVFGLLIGHALPTPAAAGVFLDSFHSLHFQAIDQVYVKGADGQYQVSAGNQPAAVGDRLLGLMYATDRSGQPLTPEVHGAFDLTVGYTQFGPTSTSQPNAMGVTRQEFVIYLPTDTLATHGNLAGGVLHSLPAGTAMALYQGGTSLSTALHQGDSLSQDINAATSGTLIGAFGLRANEYGLAGQGGAGNGYWFGVLTEHGTNDANGVFQEHSLDSRTSFYYGLMSMRSAGGEFARYQFAPSLNGTLPFSTLPFTLPIATQIDHNVGQGRPGAGQMGFDLVGNWSFSSVVTPEPGTLTLWGIGTAMLYWLRRRRAGTARRRGPAQAV